jgi:hypothetical protein
MMGTSWNKRRAEFNHDWLQNFFLLRLSRFLQLIDDLTDDPELERSFVSATLPTWESERDKASITITTFEQEMTPKRLFQNEPLSRCDQQTKAWLPDLIHSLWLRRQRIRDLVEEATVRYHDADNAYTSLQKSLTECADICSARALRNHRQPFSEFWDRCNALSEALSRLPRGTKLV